jgi:O-6-methylguanine DNA methyltransferase
MSGEIKLSPFALKVYKVVLKIPFGQVRTYKWVAKKVGKPKAFRAVGQVLKRNPLPLIIPCHRVVSSNKKIGGYIWGKRIKKKILDYERKISKLMV